MITLPTTKRGFFPFQTRPKPPELTGNPELDALILQAYANSLRGTHYVSIPYNRIRTGYDRD